MKPQTYTLFTPTNQGFPFHCPFVIPSDSGILSPTCPSNPAEGTLFHPYGFLPCLLTNNQRGPAAHPKCCTSLGSPHSSLSIRMQPAAQSHKSTFTPRRPQVKDWAIHCRNKGLRLPERSKYLHNQELVSKFSSFWKALSPRDFTIKVLALFG